MSTLALLALAADLVLLNGHVITVDDQDSITQAIAVENGLIVAVGSNEEIDALADDTTQRIDLAGATVTPGLIDAHIHLSSGGLLKLTNEDLSYPIVKSIEDITEKVAARHSIAVEGEWIRGRGWDEGKLAEQRYVLAADLDPVSGDTPVWLSHTMGHYGTANSTALKLAGITRETPDPPGGVIDRDDTGEPTGVLKETAMNLVTSLIPKAGQDQMEQAIRMMARELNREGMTAAKDPGIGYSINYDLGAAKQTWQAYENVKDSGDLSIRLFALWRGAQTSEQAEELIDFIKPFTHSPRRTAVKRPKGDRLVSGGIKLFADGSGGARTAWVWDEWNRNRTQLDEGNRGYPAFDPIVMRDLVMMYHDAGLHMGIHAVGDRAIDWAVAAITVALIRNPVHGMRHSIIHANIPTDLSLDTLAALQKKFDAGYPEPSANFTWWIGDTYAGNFGVERSMRLNPFRSFLERDMQWADGSDFFVTPFPARYGIWSSVKRQPLLGTWGSDAFGKDQSVDIQTALRSRTIWAAHQLFMEDRIGSIEPGKYADLAVWNTNIYEAPIDHVRDMKCLMTLIGGEVVYRAE